MQGVEFLTGNKADLPVLVLLHGWGYQRRAWPESLLAGLSQQYQLVLVDLPGHGEAMAVSGDDATLEQLDSWLADLVMALPPRFGLLGWSLGGQIALRLAHQYPQGVSSLVMLASNLSFVQRHDWSAAMAVDTLTSFRDAYGRSPAKTLQRFCALQAQGAQQGSMLKTLRSLIQVSADNGQQTGLYWLQYLDGREAWRQLSCPALAVLAEDDALVPVEVIDAMVELNAKAEVQSLPACHGLPFDQDLLPELEAFWSSMDE